MSVPPRAHISAFSFPHRALTLRFTMLIIKSERFRTSVLFPELYCDESLPLPPHLCLAYSDCEHATHKVSPIITVITSADF